MAVFPGDAKMLSPSREVGYYTYMFYLPLEERPETEVCSKTLIPLLLMSVKSKEVFSNIPTHYPLSPLEPTS